MLPSTEGLGVLFRGDLFFEWRKNFEIAPPMARVYDLGRFKRPAVDCVSILV